MGLADLSEQAGLSQSVDTTSQDIEKKVRAALENHLQTQHAGLSFDKYRAEILQKTLTEWPQPIMPQILRTRMAAFKEFFCDANFRMAPCACCARNRWKRKLREVCFPSPDTDDPPQWLQWSNEYWKKHRLTWYCKMDEVLNTQEYLR